MAIGSAHFPDDWRHVEVSSGWPSDTGEIDQEEVRALKAETAPYADWLLQMDRLLPFQATSMNMQEALAMERDHAIERPLEAA